MGCRPGTEEIYRERVGRETHVHCAEPKVAARFREIERRLSRLDGAVRKLRDELTRIRDRALAIEPQIADWVELHEDEQLELRKSLLDAIVTVLLGRVELSVQRGEKLSRQQLAAAWDEYMAGPLGSSEFARIASELGARADDIEEWRTEAELLASISDLHGVLELLPAVLGQQYLEGAATALSFALQDPRARLIVAGGEIWAAALVGLYTDYEVQQRVEGLLAASEDGLRTVDSVGRKLRELVDERNGLRAERTAILAST